MFFVRKAKFLFASFPKISSFSWLYAAADHLLLLLLVLSLLLAIFDKPILDLLTSTRVLKIFDNFGGLVSISIHSGFFGYSFLSSILDYGLLAYRFTHTTASSHAETTRLE